MNPVLYYIYSVHHKYYISLYIIYYIIKIYIYININKWACPSLAKWDSPAPQVQLRKWRLEGGSGPSGIFRDLATSSSWKRILIVFSQTSSNKSTFSAETIHPQEGVEVMTSDTCGRWFSFSIDHETLIYLEKKNLPEHVASLPCVNAPVPLKTVLRELEDAGEVGPVAVARKHDAKYHKLVAIPAVQQWMADQFQWIDLPSEG